MVAPCGGSGRRCPVVRDRDGSGDLPDSAALPALAQLEEQLGAMSGQHNAHLWHAGALTSRAERDHVGALAREALALFA